MTSSGEQTRAVARRPRGSADLLLAHHHRAGQLVWLSGSWLKPLGNGRDQFRPTSSSTLCDSTLRSRVVTQDQHGSSCPPEDGLVVCQSPMIVKTTKVHVEPVDQLTNTSRDVRVGRLDCRQRVRSIQVAHELIVYSTAPARSDIKHMGREIS